MLTYSLLLSLFAVASLAGASSSQAEEARSALRRREAAIFARREAAPGFVKKRHVRRVMTKQKRACKVRIPSTTTAAAVQASQTAAVVPNTSGTSSSNNNTSADEASSGSSSSSSSSTSVGLPSGITHFTGQNEGIGSWFKTNFGGDDTNGRSWCQLNYQDSWMGFAPDVTAMLSDFGNDITKAGTAYCGLEVKATNPENGNSALIYIVDGFDSKWVKTPQSIDLTLAAFKALYGETTDDKNIVVKNLQWEFTGNRKAEYSFNAGS